METIHVIESFFITSIYFIMIVSDWLTFLSNECMIVLVPISDWRMTNLLVVSLFNLFDMFNLIWLLFIWFTYILSRDNRNKSVSKYLENTWKYYGNIYKKTKNRRRTKMWRWGPFVWNEFRKVERSREKGGNTTFLYL